MKNHITVDQLYELNSGDYVWLQIKSMGFRSFRNQESMDEQVSKYMTVKNMKIFLNQFNAEIIPVEIDELWEQVKDTVKNNNC